MQRRITERILLVVSAAFLFASIFGWFGSTLPEYYESKTVLAIKPPQVSGKVVRSLTENELIQIISPMSQEIFRSSSLEPMINKYSLFEEENAQGITTEISLQSLEKNIRVEIEKSEEGYLKGFSIIYRDRVPENARNVAAELANKYTNSPIGKEWKESWNIESFRVVETANLPQSPISPTWLDFTLIGAGFGFFVGLIVLGLSRLANILRIRFAELDLQ